VVPDVAEERADDGQERQDLAAEGLQRVLECASQSLLGSPYVVCCALLYEGARRMVGLLRSHDMGYLVDMGLGT